MDANLTRRDLVARGLPAVLAGGAFATGAFTTGAFAQDAPATNRQDGQAPGGTIAAKLAEAYADGKYVLPQLPYAYDALEPHIDATTMQIHHSRHQQGYVDGLNDAIERMREITTDGKVADAELGELQRNLSFHGGGHLNHTIFFAGMSPDGGGEPSGQIAQAINDTFGSFKSFKDYFSKAAVGVKGSGWGVLAYEPVGDN
ncbi:MAG: superoxide dismutase, partial [Gemmatimonadota bacterium]